MEIRSLFDIIIYNMDNKVAPRIMAIEASFAKDRPINIATISSKIYLAMSPLVRGILEGTAIAFR
jgi:hypothetical protein